MSNNPPSSTAPVKVEKRGYHKLALLMDEQNETAIFRRFGKLNLLNLMALQAELVELEDDFNTSWDDDETSTDPDRKQLAVSFKALRKSQSAIASPNSRASENAGASPTVPEPKARQGKILLDIREKLKEYSQHSSSITQLHSNHQQTQHCYN
jgi:hypothetical protein